MHLLSKESRSLPRPNRDGVSLTRLSRQSVSRVDSGEQVGERVSVVVEQLWSTLSDRNRRCRPEMESSGSQSRVKEGVKANVVPVPASAITTDKTHPIGVTIARE